MITVGSNEFANALGISERAARKHLARSQWRGFDLPVIKVNGQRGGDTGASWALCLDLCPPELLVALGMPEHCSEKTPVNTVVNYTKNMGLVAAQDKMRLIAPILATPKGSSERAAIIAQIAAGSPHKVGQDWRALSVRTLRYWVALAETSGASLVKRQRPDIGKKRVLVSRQWDSRCDLPLPIMERVADELERTGRGALLKGMSERAVVRTLSKRLHLLSQEAGSAVSLEDCHLTRKFTARFAQEMKVAHQFKGDNKRYTDRHEMHVRRGLDPRPMQTLLCDVHTVDITIAEGARLWLIAWMDGSSGFIWATPVITTAGQGITQEDVARSLYQVVSSPYGGMPDKFLIDNGSEYKFLEECVLRLSVMAEMSGLGVITCRPHHPEGKAQLEGAFGIWERSFVSALSGYNGGNILRPRLRGRGKAVRPYQDGVEAAIHDINHAVALYNGTPQNGDLGGLSPKAMLEAKIKATGWTAQNPDEDVFDLIFSREEKRDVRQGNITIGGRAYSGDVLAEMMGEKQASFLVPYRNPDGQILHFKQGVIHKLTVETFGLADNEGSKRKAHFTALQKAEISRRIASADAKVDVVKLLTDAADLTPIDHNPPDTWSMGLIDKGGFMTAPISEQEARQIRDQEARDLIEEILPRKAAVGRGAAGATANPSSAT